MANVIDYDRSLRVNVRNQSGPQREILSVEQTPSAALVSLSCGHVGQFNPIYHYKVGTQISCFNCRFAPDNVISSELL